jgi:hypothetical protein
MFKLLKLAVFGMIGYAIYQFYQGIQSGQIQLGGKGRPGRRSHDQGEAFSRGYNITGPGEGREETTADSTCGAGITHRVGRGVVR